MVFWRNAGATRRDSVLCANPRKACGYNLIVGATCATDFAHIRSYSVLREMQPFATSIMQFCSASSSWSVLHRRWQDPIRGVHALIAAFSAMAPASVPTRHPASRLAPWVHRMLSPPHSHVALTAEDFSTSVTSGYAAKRRGVPPAPSNLAIAARPSSRL